MSTGTPFTTFFGDYLHGLWITWTPNIEAGTGNTTFKMTMQANYRSRRYTWVNSAATPTADTHVPNVTYDFSSGTGGTPFGTKQTF